MEYIVYKRFRGEGIDGPFNLRHGTCLLYTSDAADD